MRRKEHSAEGSWSHRSAQWQYSPPLSSQRQSALVVVVVGPSSSSLPAAVPPSTPGASSSGLALRTPDSSAVSINTVKVLSGDARPGSGVGKRALASATSMPKASSVSLSATKGMMTWLVFSEVMEGEGIEGHLASLLVCFICASLCGYRFLKSLMASSAKASSLFTHWLSDARYPFHLTRYCSLRPLPNLLESRTASTSYSSDPSTRSGGGRW